MWYKDKLSVTVEAYLPYTILKIYLKPPENKNTNLLKTMVVKEMITDS